MEKRIAGIIRWLERCLEAHRAGELESALMDVECARADMDILRDGFWSKLDRRRAAQRRRAFAASLVKTVLGIAAVILATASPLALPRERPREETGIEKAAPEPTVLRPAVLEPVPVQVDANAKSPQAQTLRATQTLRAPQALPAAQALPGAQAAPMTQAAPAARAVPAEGRDGKRGIGINLSYDNILALVQTGERALKNEKPVIEVVEVIE